MFKLTQFARTRAPLPGVPWRDLSDDEYKAAAARFPEGALNPYFREIEEERPRHSRAAVVEEPEPEEVTGSPPAEEENSAEPSAGDRHD